jgi:nicotinate-nucleotide pyrophosphorylase (carboxylating)
LVDRNRLVDELVGRALEEDASFNDRTTRLLVSENTVGNAIIRVNSAGVISGQNCAETVFRLLDSDIRYSPIAGDGSRVKSADTIARMSGKLTAILSGERTALNFLQHLSGIATLTAAFVERVKGTGVVILDTRKTTPGLRFLEKEAVVHGGGRNHRANLERYILVKENHITAAWGLPAVLDKLGTNLHEAEIEVSSLDELRSLRDRQVGRVMLDNFTPSMLTAALEELKRWDSTPEVEVSGGINLDTITSCAQKGVDFVSVGSLTSSAPVLDMTLMVEGKSKDNAHA